MDGAQALVTYRLNDDDLRSEIARGLAQSNLSDERDEVTPTRHLRHLHHLYHFGRAIPASPA